MLATAAGNKVVALNLALCGQNATALGGRRRSFDSLCRGPFLVSRCEWPIPWRNNLTRLAHGGFADRSHSVWRSGHQRRRGRLRSALPLSIIPAAQEKNRGREDGMHQVAIPDHITGRVLNRRGKLHIY